MNGGVRGLERVASMNGRTAFTILSMAVAILSGCYKKSPMPTCQTLEVPPVNGHISGHLQDVFGRPIAGAVVILENNEKKTTKSAATDANGNFCIPGIVPGPDYELKTETPEYYSVVISHVNIVKGYSGNLVITLTDNPNVIY